MKRTIDRCHNPTIMIVTQITKTKPSPNIKEYIWSLPHPFGKHHRCWYIPARFSHLDHRFWLHSHRSALFDPRSRTAIETPHSLDRCNMNLCGFLWPTHSRLHTAVQVRIAEVCVVDVRENSKRNHYGFRNYPETGFTGIVFIKSELLRDHYDV